MIKHWIKTQKPWILILVPPLRHPDVKRVTCLCFKLTALKIEITAHLESDLFWYTHVLQCTFSTDYKPQGKTNLEITEYCSFRILIIISITYSPFQMWYQVLLSNLSCLEGHGLSHFGGNSRLLVFRRWGEFLWD